ncbi:serine/threonine-protein kinase [Devriesea agamarum]|uniref:serine/threonine-protein kinase n=1 Tax=Devriesea agamarum TaxID=472569 RepID=UPI00071CA9FF|nr:serine/threonine-protein kinase [Devriesea agamarum]
MTDFYRASGGDLRRRALADESGYDVAERIGSGGMGIVYRARDAEGRDVAIKMLRPEIGGDQQARQRLAREVKALQRVRSDNIAQVLDAELESDEAFIVTEFIQGPTLDEAARRHGGLHPEAVREIGVMLGETLQTIHRAGLVHRDLKPSNILLRGATETDLISFDPDGERLDPVIIDFGIAQAAEESRLTSTGLVMGTAAYLDPELARTNITGPAADWWAWAALVAFAATGRDPFGSGRVDLVLMRAEKGEIDSAGAPAELRRWLRDALQPDPADRVDPGQLIQRLAQLDLTVYDDPGATEVLSVSDLHSGGGESAGAAASEASSEAVTSPLSTVSEPLPTPVGGMPPASPVTPLPPTVPVPAGAPGLTGRSREDDLKTEVISGRYDASDAPTTVLSPLDLHGALPSAGAAGAAGAGTAGMGSLGAGVANAGMAGAGVAGSRMAGALGVGAAGLGAESGPRDNADSTEVLHGHVASDRTEVLPNLGTNSAPTQVYGQGYAVPPQPGYGMPTQPGYHMPAQPGYDLAAQPAYGAPPAPWPPDPVQSQQSVRRRPGIIWCGHLLLVLLATVVPYLAFGLFLLLNAVARTWLRGARQLERRRSERGPRAGDAWAVGLVSPWRLLWSFAESILMSMLPVLLAVLLAFSAVGLLHFVGAVAPSDAFVTAGMMAIVLLLTWVGPASRMTRDGAHRLVDAAAPTFGWTAGILALLIVVAGCIIAAAMTRHGHVDYVPFPQAQLMQWLAFWRS